MSAGCLESTASVSLKKTVLLPISRFCFSDWGQLRDFGLLLVLGEDRPVGVNVLHREKEGDSFYFSPKKKSKKAQKLYIHDATTWLQIHYICQL